MISNHAYNFEQNNWDYQYNHYAAWLICERFNYLKLDQNDQTFSQLKKRDIIAIYLWNTFGTLWWVVKWELKIKDYQSPLILYIITNLLHSIPIPSQRSGWEIMRCPRNYIFIAFALSLVLNLAVEMTISKCFFPHNYCLRSFKQSLSFKRLCKSSYTRFSFTKEKLCLR